MTGERRDMQRKRWKQMKTVLCQTFDLVTSQGIRRLTRGLNGVTRHIETLNNFARYTAVNQGIKWGDQTHRNTEQPMQGWKNVSHCSNRCSHLIWNEITCFQLSQTLHAEFTHRTWISIHGWLKAPNNREHFFENWWFKNCFVWATKDLEKWSKLQSEPTQT